ncbi:MAG TPA: NAD(P)H-binding protein, partial [Polyangiaceae bacterium]|nr:NAD(P)H-binding protein [Polyangiaceae bacterium]
RILVLGATGFVGRALVDALVDAGEEVRAASRHANSGDERDPGPPQRVRCDLRKPETLAAVLEGVDCVYYLVHSMGEGRPDFRAVERECAHNLARAAEASGCRRVVYLGGVAPRGEPSEHLASRLEVGSILRDGGVPTVELRAAMIIGVGSVSWKIVRDLALRLPIMILPRWLDSRTRPIAIADVVVALLDARRITIEESEWFDIPGPEVLSARQILRRVALLRGRHIPMLRVPVLTPRLSALWLQFVTGANYAVARELVLGLGEDLLPRDARYWRLIGHETLRSFDDAAELALEAEARPQGLSALGERLVEATAGVMSGARRLEAPRARLRPPR